MLRTAQQLNPKNGLFRCAWQARVARFALPARPYALCTCQSRLLLKAELTTKPSKQVKSFVNHLSVCLKKHN